MVRGRFIFCLTVLGLCSAGAVFAINQSSPNFQNEASTFAPAVFSSNSSNFTIEGSVDAITGASASPSFSVHSGVPLGAGVTPASPPAPAGQTGGGGLSGNQYNNQNGTGYVAQPGKDILPAPSLIFRSPTFKSVQRIGGTRTASETIIVVNGSSKGVTFPTPTTWQLDLPLFLGYNDIFLRAKDASGDTSPIIGGQIQRLLIGDVNTDHVVNDRDLSLFTRAWKKFTPFADFNEDGLIGDADLSLLASHWGIRY